jgi:uncharacterized protein
MFESLSVKTIIPALNEAEAIAEVISAIPSWVDEVVVVDNGSTDETPSRARAAGARVIHEPRRGYGQACLTGLAELGHCDVVVFLDGDYSDYPEDMPALVAPIAAGTCDMVLGSRPLGGAGPESLTIQQRLGNALACFLMKLFWRESYTDLGPFRAIRAGALRSLGMCDRNYGWTIEMQIKAIRTSLRIAEVPVRYRPRIGTSKVSGTLRGTLCAGAKILGTIARHALARETSRRVASQRIILFSRYPLPGTAKTRLIPALGPCGAAALQRRMTEQTLTTAIEAGDELGADIEVRYADGDAARMRRWLGARPQYIPQGAGDLGDRMARALKTALDQGCQRVVVIGTDCPALTPQHLYDAMDALATNDLVLGPSDDGGYWLIGMSRLCPVFADVAWGGPTVLEATLAHASLLGLRVHLLEELQDIDTPADLEHAGLGASERPPWLSVVIPTLDEEGNIEACVRSAQADGVEIVVVDGGSSDETRTRATRQGARVVTGERGRARQMNRGAEVAHAKVLLFLHADTRLPPGYVREVFDLLSDPRTDAGAFSFGCDADDRLLALVAWGANIRSRYFRLPYGDQALFVRRKAFEEIGGFPAVPIAEDLRFVLARGLRGRLRVTASPICTSTRRWQSSGPFLNSCVNAAILVGCLLGISPSHLARVHRFRERRRGEKD